MSNSDHHKIDYIEFASVDLAHSKAFFEAVFSWQFEDFGPDYTAFSEGAGFSEGIGMSGGFYHAALSSKAEDGAALIVFYSDDLVATAKLIAAHGGTIVKPIFSFPGGRRFHFTEPMGNEFAVWSDV